MTENNRNSTWWKPALEIFGKMSSWVIVPVVAALVVGKKLDGYYGTKPWIFLGLTAISFIVSISGIVITLKEYLRSAEASPQSDKTNGIGNKPTN